MVKLRALQIQPMTQYEVEARESKASPSTSCDQSRRKDDGFNETTTFPPNPYDVVPAPALSAPYDTAKATLAPHISGRRRFQRNHDLATS